MTEQNKAPSCFVTEQHAKLLQSSHDVIQAPSLATGCEPEGSPATGGRHRTSLAKSKPKNKIKMVYVRSERAAPSLIWSQEAGFFFWNPPWFIQLQNVNHSRLNLGIRFVLYLVLDQQCRSRDDQQFESDTRIYRKFCFKTLLLKNETRWIPRTIQRKC